jgi:hypothetical protein
VLVLVAPAYGIGNAPAVCDVVTTYAPKVQDAFHKLMDTADNADPSKDSDFAEFQSKQSDLVQKLHDETDAIDHQDVPTDFRDPAGRYTTAERNFAEAIRTADIGSFQSDIDERDAAQHALFAKCNDAIDTPPTTGAPPDAPSPAPRNEDSVPGDNN